MSFLNLVPGFQHLFQQQKNFVSYCFIVFVRHVYKQSLINGIRYLGYKLYICFDSIIGGYDVTKI